MGALECVPGAVLLAGGGRSCLVKGTGSFWQAVGTQAQACVGCWAEIWLQGALLADLSCGAETGISSPAWASSGVQRGDVSSGFGECGVTAWSASFSGAGLDFSV